MIKKNKEMKHILVLFMLCFQHFVTAQNTTIKSSKISFTFASKNVKGTLIGFESTSNIDLNAIENSKFKGTVDAATIDTGNSVRNWSLRRGKYFDVDKYPKITFESSSIVASANGFTVKGQLTIKATTKPITIDFIRTDTSFTGTTTLFSSDYGITIIKKEKEKNKVDVKFVFELQ